MLQGEKTSLAARRTLARGLREGNRIKVAMINYRKSGEPYRCEVKIFPIQASKAHCDQYKTHSPPPGRQLALTV
jgi:hypothetical protein